MKPNGNFNIINLRPKLQISNYDLEAIRHIVAIAPQEAQWYHTVTKERQGSELVYKIAGMYIPEQWTAAASVETDENMMVTFFKEIREAHGSKKVNQIISTMTCWCHSHHTMGVSPSSQDNKQFNKQCENAMRDKVTSPQIMMIFNKSDSYYCRIFDPEFNLVFENVPMVEDPYDFSFIDRQAKTKFKKKKSVSKFNWSTKKKTKNVDILDWKNSDFENNYYLDPDDEMESSLIDEFKKTYRSLRIYPKLQVVLGRMQKSTSSKHISMFINEISRLTYPEISTFAYLLECLVNRHTKVLGILDTPTAAEQDPTLMLSQIEGLVEAVEDDEIEAALIVACNLDCFDLIQVLEDFDLLVVQSEYDYTSLTSK